MAPRMRRALRQTKYDQLLGLVGAGIIQCRGRCRDHGHILPAVTTLVGDAQQVSPWTQTYIDANPDIIKARRRANMEPEWRFRRPVAVNVDADDRIFVLESARARLQVYDKLKDYEEHSINL